MVEIPNQLINWAGFIALFVGSLYMLSAYGESLRETDHRGAQHFVYAVEVFAEDVRFLVGGFVMILVGAFGWAFAPMNFGAAFAALTAWAGMAWFWFVNLVMSGLNVLGVTDFGISQIIAAAVIFGVAAIIIRRYRD
jgi:hypothetical protein